MLSHTYIHMYIDTYLIGCILTHGLSLISCKYGTSLVSFGVRVLIVSLHSQVKNMERILELLVITGLVLLKHHVLHIRIPYIYSTCALL